MTQSPPNLTPAKNLLTDIAGLRVGHAHDEQLASGATVILGEAPMTAAFMVMGGGPGSRELNTIALDASVGALDALVFSGGSAFGLDAAGGVQSYLRAEGRGYAVGDARVPIVPQAIVFDLLNGGDKDWGLHSPYRDLGYQAAQNASADFALGSVGAGYGATVALPHGGRMRGGLGSASEQISGLSKQPITVAALVAVNSVGVVTIGETKHFWAAGFERESEFGGFGLPSPWPQNAATPVFKQPAKEIANTTLCVVATDAKLSQKACHRIAVMASAGMARAIVPVFSAFDGDVVFALTTSAKPVVDERVACAMIGAVAANCLARAIARGIYEARGSLPQGTHCHRDVFKL